MESLWTRLPTHNSSQNAAYCVATFLRYKKDEEEGISKSALFSLVGKKRIFIMSPGEFPHEKDGDGRRKF